LIHSDDDEIIEPKVEENKHKRKIYTVEEILENNPDIVRDDDIYERLTFL
jgi:hypothetical protein